MDGLTVTNVLTRETEYYYHFIGNCNEYNVTRDELRFNYIFALRGRGDKQKNFCTFIHIRDKEYKTNRLYIFIIEFHTIKIQKGLEGVC